MQYGRCVSLLRVTTFWAWAVGGIIIIAFALAFRLHHALLTGVASGVALILAFWQPLHLFTSSTMRLFPLLFLFILGFTFSHLSTTSILSIMSQKRSSADTLSTLSVTGFSMSFLTIQSILSCIVVSIHALAEGFALGAAAPKAYEVGELYMLFPISLHGLPRGAAVASSIFGATHSWCGSLAAATVVGFMGPLSAIGAILGQMDSGGLDHLMVFACWGLIQAFSGIYRRAVKLDTRKSVLGLMMGMAFVIVCLTCSKLVFFHTPYCDSVQEAVR